MKADTYAFPNLDKLPRHLKEEVVGPRRSLNVYRMIMHTPAVAPSFLAFSDALRHLNSLPASWRELAILCVGHRYQAAYEIHHHERLARSAGLREEAIAATRAGSAGAGLLPEERLILELTEEILADHGLCGQSRDRALGQLTTNQLADLVLTVGFYQLVCNFLSTFGVPIESQPE